MVTEFLQAPAPSAERGRVIDDASFESLKDDGKDVNLTPVQGVITCGVDLCIVDMYKYIYIVVRYSRKYIYIIYIYIYICPTENGGLTFNLWLS
jgi:hypothetical protein